MPALHNIQTTDASLTFLLGGHTFEIPELQRPYAWEAAQVNDFVNDIIIVMDVLRNDPSSSAEHLFGMVVTIGEAHGEQSVVDGQQRLTTTSLALGVLEAEYAALRSQIEGGPQDKLKVDCLVHERTLRNLIFREAPHHDAPRLTTSKEIRLTYESLVTGGAGLVAAENRRPAKLLRDAAKVIRESLMRDSSRFDLNGPAKVFAHLRLVENVLLNRLKFIHVRTTSADSGYGLFETLNTRGQSLNALDLVKVWVMSQLVGTPIEEMVAKQFRGISNDDRLKQLEFLRDYFRAQVQQSPDDTDEVSFAKDVRRYIFRDPSLVKIEPPVNVPARIVEHVDRMESWYDLWLDISRCALPFPRPTDDDETALNAFGIERLKVLLGTPLRHTLPMPLLLHVADRFDRRDFIRVVHDLERFFFRFKKIGGAPVGPMENVYFSWCRKLRDAKKPNLAGFAKDLQAVLDSHVDDARFQMRLVEGLDSSRGGYTAKAVYFFQMLQRYEGKAGPALTSSPLTHIVPIQPAETLFADPEMFHRLGNLMAVTTDERNALKTLNFTQRKVWVAANGLSSTISRKAFEAAAWDSAQVERHEKLLLKRAVQVFSFS